MSADPSLPDLPEGAETVRLQLPAEAGNLRLVRLVVAALASQHDADLEDLEDLRLAAGEACADLVTHARDGGRLEVEAAIRDGTVSVRASVPATDPAAELDPLAAALLATVTDRFGVEADGALRTAWFERRLGRDAPVR